jgi:hypothetical protein
MSQTRKPSLSKDLRKLLSTALASHVGVHAGYQLMVQSREQGIAPQSPKSYKVVDNLAAYSVSLARAARSGLSNAERAGTVLLVTLSSGAVALAEIHQKKGQPALTRVSSGPAVSRIERALVVLRQRSRASSNRSVQFRFVNVPGIHINCVWRHHAKNSVHDRLVPILHNFAGLHVGKPYSRSEVDAVIEAEAGNAIIAWYERQQRLAKQQSADSQDRVLSR